MYHSMADQVKLFCVQAELWKTPRVESTSNFDLEDQLAFGIFLFDRLCELDERFRLSGAECDPELDAQILQFYRQWGKAANNCLSALLDLESKGLSTRYATEFRQRCLEARGVLATEINYRPPAKEQSKKETLDESLSRVTDDNRHGEIDFGPPAGKEAW